MGDAASVGAFAIISYIADAESESRSHNNNTSTPAHYLNGVWIVSINKVPSVYPCTVDVCFYLIYCTVSLRVLRGAGDSP